MNKIIEKALTKMRASRKPFLQRRNILTKIQYRLNLFIAYILGSIFAFLYLNIFLNTNKSLVSVRVLLKRRFWIIFCKYFEKQRGGGGVHM
jgi:NhaP-type Na+/H+ or K+/H+ antiporter